MPQVERRASNESIFREVNEEIASLGATAGREQIEIVCECATIGCSVPLVIGAEHYEAARREPEIFIVFPGHEDPSLERVVADHGDFLFVRKTGEAAEAARATDPRS
jgi:hypothetical protein